MDPSLNNISGETAAAAIPARPRSARPQRPFTEYNVSLELPYTNRIVLLLTNE